MLHSDLLDSPSHVNIQEWRERERGGKIDGEQSQERAEERKGISTATVREGERERLGRR